jgi:hypothetical protein
MKEMQTFIEKEQKRLIKRFHALLGKSGLGNAGKDAILSGYGVESTRDLTVAQLLEICNAIHARLHGNTAELDAWRKRLMASIGGWLRMTGDPGGAARIISIACRAAKRDNFNDIPLEQLRSLYAAFCNKQRDSRAVDEVMVNELMASGRPVFTA